ncbi:MAG TPA: hypothetical protein VH439_17160 [Gemmatimonadales bacterium]|jgi:hypothetical protein
MKITRLVLMTALLASCTAPHTDCSHEIAYYESQPGALGEENGRQRPDGSYWTRIYFADGTAVLLEWGGPLKACKVTHEPST